MRKKNKLVFGVGTNDADYPISPATSGKRVACVLYQTWTDMLRRCYSGLAQEAHPTYKECSVCDEWLVFSSFRKWMILQDYKGKQLDKDILLLGNKIYSPDACVFVSADVNTLLNDCAAARGKYKQGVTYHRRDKKFQSSFSAGGKRSFLGYYDTEDEAYAAYVAAKSAYIRKIAGAQGGKVKDALYARADELENTLKTED